MRGKIWVLVGLLVVGVVSATDYTNLLNEFGLQTTGNVDLAGALNVSGRVFESNTTTTVWVSNCAELQAEIAKIPERSVRSYNIYARDGIYDCVIVTPKFDTQMFIPGGSEQLPVTIVGNTTTPCGNGVTTGTRIKGVVINTASGVMPLYWQGWCHYGQTGLDDENNSISIYSGGGGTVGIADIRFLNGSVNGSINSSLRDGIDCYDSRVYVSDIDIGDGILRYGFESKYNCNMINVNTALYGNATTTAIYMRDGGKMIFQSSLPGFNLTSSNPRAIADCATGGKVTDSADSHILCGEKGAETSVWTVEGNNPDITCRDTYATGQCDINLESTATNTKNFTMAITSLGFDLYRKDLGTFKLMHVDSADNQMCFGRGQTCTADFQINRTTQIEADSDSTPTAEVIQNGTSDGLKVACSNNNTCLNVDSEADDLSSYGIFVDTLEGGFVAKFQTSTENYVLVGPRTNRVFRAYRNIGSATTTLPVAEINQDNSGDDQDALNIKQDGTGKGINIDQNGNGIGLYIDNAGTSHALVTTGGFVGINTTSPGQTLTVVGIANTTDQAYYGKNITLEQGNYITAQGASGGLRYNGSGWVLGG